MAYADSLRQQYATFTSAADLIDGVLSASTVFSAFNLSSTSGAVAYIYQYSADTTGGFLSLRKSRGASVGTNTIVASGDVIGNIVFQGANGTGYTDGARIRALISTTPGATNDMPTDLVFETVPDGSGTLSERMRIDRRGRVGMGNSSVGSSLDVYNVESASIYTAFFYSTVAGDVAKAAVAIGKKDNNSTTSQIFMLFAMNSAGTGSGQINANGASQAAFGSFSDIRLKENITDLPPQLDKLLALRPVEFDYKDGSGHQIGFIAQEVEQIYPDLIGTAQDGMLTLSGLGKNESRLIKSIQELNDKITQLESRIRILEG